ncbi:MAG: arginine N-succinyltransferase [Gammaproteobacteria bacterium]|nr:arginine N-succinyltransferase [Gammaproteobacteria bacterium]
MWVVRPAQASDAEQLVALAKQATLVHTLPRTAADVGRYIERSLLSFASAVIAPSNEFYVLVLQDADGGLGGVAAVSATAGADGTFFAFRNDVINQVARDLRIAHDVQVLTLCSDLTSYSQLLSFFARPASVDRSGADLLSRARLMLATLAPQRFADGFFVSLAGWNDADRQSPFWEAIGRKFFGMDYLQAEQAVQGARNRTLIVELMPYYPIYAALLPDSAKNCLGKPHPASELPFEILNKEGLQPGKYIDIFDGGPILQAHRSQIKSLTTATTLVAKPAAQTRDQRRQFLVSCNRFSDFRCVLTDAEVQPSDNCIYLPPATFHALEIEAGMRVMVAEG